MNNAVPAPKAARLPYRSPTLRLFGTLRALTAAGNAGNNEFLSMGDMVNCGTNMTRMC